MVNDSAVIAVRRSREQSVAAIEAISLQAT
jgi:hypothetical protein